jgi:hypothetical protein
MTRDRWVAAQPAPRLFFLSLSTPLKMARQGVRVLRPTRPAGPVANSAERGNARPTRDDDLNFALARSAGRQTTACEFRHDRQTACRKVLAGRKPLLLLRLSGWLLLRLAERTFDV